MGFYVETGANFGKAEYLIEKHRAEEVSVGAAAAHINDAEKGVVCVIDNGVFEAAGYVYNEREFRAVTLRHDFRPKRFLLMDRKKLEELSRFDSKRA